MSDTYNIFVPLLSQVAKSTPMPFVIIPELALFAIKKKRSLRLVVPRVHLEELLAQLSRMEIASFEIHDINSIPSEQGDWSSIVSATHSTTTLVVLSLDKNARDIVKAELDGDATYVGNALGYPPCCIQAYEKHAGSGWASSLIERSGPPPWPVWSNRLTEHWGGASPIGELFPCSLTCTRSINLGKMADRALRDIGAFRLADEIMRQASQPLTMRYDGFIERWNENSMTPKLDFHV